MNVNPSGQSQFPASGEGGALPKRVKGAGPSPGEPSKQPGFGPATPPANRPDKAARRAPMAPLPDEKMRHAQSLIEHRGMTVDEVLMLVAGRLDVDPADADKLAEVFAQTQAAGGAKLDGEDMQRVKDQITFEGHSPEQAFRMVAKFWPPHADDIRQIERHAQQVEAAGGPRLSDASLALAESYIVNDGMTVDEAFAAVRKGALEGSNFTQLREDDRAKLAAVTAQSRPPARLGFALRGVLQKLAEGQSLEEALPERFRNAPLHDRDIEIIDEVLKRRERGTQPEVAPE